MKTTYTILLVDDEEAVRTSIKNLTPWAEYGFEVMAEASNGQEALEIVYETMPDVIITDIKMPYMDGIKFISRVREELSETVNVIFLSGYDEFTYAQTALQLNAAEYVLKPVSVKTMSDLLRRMKERLDKDLALVSDMERLEASYREAFELYKEKFLISLISPAKAQDEEFLESKAEEYKLPISGKMFAAAVVDIPADSLSLEAMRNIITEEERPLSFIYENQLIMIFSSEMNKDFTQLFIKQISREMQLLQDKIIHYFSKPFNMGIGEVVYHIKLVHESFRSAMEALNYSEIYPEQHIISISDVERVERTYEKTLGERRSDLVMAIKFGTDDDVGIKTGAFFRNLTDPADVQQVMLAFITTISEICIAYGANIASLLEGEDLFMLLSKANTAARANELALRIALAARKMTAGIRENSHIQFIEKAKNIIKERYSDPNLRLDHVADEIAVSPAYFSTTFKKETGISFVQYITNVRIEKAKELLKNTDEKTYEIAEEIGFSDPNYFSFAFKKNIGLSPSQYRTKARS